MNVKKNLSGIVAMTRHTQVMGKNNQLPWSLPGDLKFFRATTLGHRIIMGRKTFESIGSKPLPKREHWVLSSKPCADNLSHGSDVRFFQTKEEILKALENDSSGIKSFIIGGAQVFEIFWKEIDEFFVTWIDHDFEGDIFFPTVNWDEFQLLQERREIDPISHSFCHLTRKKL
jgi:dihydrofolate reductase